METQRELPRVIFLDAVGTLFGVQGSVGSIYSTIAQEFGVTIAPAALDRGFIQSFRAAGLPAFSWQTHTDLESQEFEWWLAIAQQTFQIAEVYDAFADFRAFFTHLYAHFATAEPWVVYPDVPGMLAAWRSQGVTLGVVSNFDSRLYAVLQALDLDRYFASVTLSTEAGVAKPNPQIFQIALAKHQCLPQQAWHIGDSYEEDYQAAQAAGLRGIWLRRDHETTPRR